MNLPENEILIGDAIEQLRKLPDSSVHCCVTSPPYWGLRDYGVKGQLGLEKTPNEYVERMVEVFRDVRRVLRDDGTLWLNLGDSYLNAKGQAGGVDPKQPARRHGLRPNDVSIEGLKRKDLIGIPWRVAFALQADGWYLRSDIIWSKSNPMPESVTDRPTKSHEYIFLMSKSVRYFCDMEAIKEPNVSEVHYRNGCPGPEVQSPGQIKQSGFTKIRRSGNKARVYGEGRGRPGSHLAGSIPWWDKDGYRNRRTVWSVATKPFTDAHFAVFPEKLIEPCILAGCPEGGVVLDPFMGSGTTALVALKTIRKFIGIELNPEYAQMAEQRIWSEKNQERLF